MPANLEMGHIDLGPGREFSAGDPAGTALQPGTGNARSFETLVERMTARLPDAPGVTLWGAYRDDFRWTPIFIAGHPSLRQGVRDTLVAERALFWSERHLVAELQRLLPDGSDGDEALAQAYRKRACAHLFWHTLHADDDLDVVGDDLVRYFRPAANDLEEGPPQRAGERALQCILQLNTLISNVRLEARAQHIRASGPPRGACGKLLG